MGTKRMLYATLWILLIDMQYPSAECAARCQQQRHHHNMQISTGASTLCMPWHQKLETATHFGKYGYATLLEDANTTDARLWSTYSGAKGWQQHHDDMAPACQPQQAQRAQRGTQTAVPKHLEQHESASTHHQDLANLPTAHAQAPMFQILAAEDGQQLIVQRSNAPHDEVGQHCSTCIMHRDCLSEDMSTPQGVQSAATAPKDCGLSWSRNAWGLAMSALFGWDHGMQLVSAQRGL